MPRELHVFLNTDGVPLSKSTNHQFWPILCVLEDPLGMKHTFEIGIYYGTKKPQDFNEFLVIIFLYTI